MGTFTNENPIIASNNLQQHRNLIDLVKRMEDQKYHSTKPLLYKKESVHQ